MKLYATLAASALLSFPAYGAVVLSTTFTNLQGTSDNESNLVISDNTGSTIAANTGFVAIGTFNSSNAAIASLSTPAALDSAFKQFGASTTMGSFGGSFSAQATQDPDTLFDGVNAFTGSSVYIVVGNSSTLALSTEFLVWDSGVLFANTDPSGSPDEVILDVGSGSLVIGLDNKHTFDLSIVAGGSATQAAFTAVELVPEPSSTALLGLGGVALLLRRRR